jgi:hypothetical protein
VDEIGGLIVDLIRNAAKARAARQASPPFRRARRCVGS